MLCECLFLKHMTKLDWPSEKIICTESLKIAALKNGLGT